MIITKYVKQKMEVLKSKQPDLYTTVNTAVPFLSDDYKGIIAGLIIEAVIKSGGDVTIFEDEFDTPQLEEELFN